MSTHTITLTINGARESLDVPANTTLLQLLREKLALTGTKNGCAAGECGACTVMMNGEPVTSCMVLAVEAEGAEVLTVEGLAQEGRLDDLQQAFVDEGAVQCGFCTPGFLMSGASLLAEHQHPTLEQIRQSITGNLCRCTGYYTIIKAIEKAAQASR
jgi:carbon-monoxide dehydrogenase small subunit